MNHPDVSAGPVVNELSGRLFQCTRDNVGNDVILGWSLSRECQF